MIKIVKYKHHNDEEVSVQEHLKGKHSDHCLCWQNCKNFKPGKKENCYIAQKLYSLCVNYNIVTPVWECPLYVKKEV